MEQTIREADPRLAAPEPQPRRQAREGDVPAAGLTRGRAWLSLGGLCLVVGCVPNVSTNRVDTDDSNTSAASVDSGSQVATSASAEAESTNGSGAPSTASSSGEALSTTSSSAGGPTFDATGVSYYTCAPTEGDCGDGFCAPWDGQNLGIWSALTCFDEVPKPRRPGAQCFMRDGPLAPQVDCGPGLVCLAETAVSTEGICARIEPSGEVCEHLCPEIGQFLCLAELGCPAAGPFCNSAGC